MSVNYDPEEQDPIWVSYGSKCEEARKEARKNRLAAVDKYCYLHLFAPSTWEYISALLGPNPRATTVYQYLSESINLRNRFVRLSRQGTNGQVETCETESREWLGTLRRWALNKAITIGGQPQYLNDLDFDRELQKLLHPEGFYEDLEPSPLLLLLYFSIRMQPVGYGVVMYMFGLSTLSLPFVSAVSRLPSC
jgi:hypothetical protein